MGLWEHICGRAQTLCDCFAAVLRVCPDNVGTRTVLQLHLDLQLRANYIFQCLEF